MQTRILIPINNPNSTKQRKIRRLIIMEKQLLQRYMVKHLLIYYRSLGCLIFQIITLIPLGTKDRYVIKGRNYSRKGLLYIGQFSYAELLRKQRLFSTQATRIIKKQCDSQFIHNIDNRVIEVMEKMLVFNRDRRIKPQEVINILNKLV